MKTNAQRDYADSGMTIRIKTGDSFVVPTRGLVRGEFLSSKSNVEQGFDLSVEGWLELAHGERIQTLRTWHDPAYEPVVEYPFYSEDSHLWVWNVYKMQYPGGQRVEEKWTENAGMWVEEVSPVERIYHCSNGMAHPPDFESLVFKITIKIDKQHAQ